MKTPNDHARWLFTLVACQLLIPACAAAYSAQLRWNAPTDPAVAGYHLYVREGDAPYGAPRDVVPDADGDGAVVAVLSDLTVEKTYTFAVSAYASDGTESERSNERSLGYAQAAAVVDSDGDGLTDADEDVNLNGAQDPGETDRLNPDSDGDLVPDGVERPIRSTRRRRPATRCRSATSGSAAAVSPTSSGMRRSTTWWCTRRRRRVTRCDFAPRTPPTAR